MDFASLKLPRLDRQQLSHAIFAIKSRYFRALHRWNKPGFKSGVFRAVGWGFFATFYGLLVGGSAALLPPMVSVALVAMSGPVLFWALPDFPTIPVKTLKRVFFLTIAVELSVPTYYMVQITGLPWISIRRLFVFALILLTLYSISVSPSERRALSKVMSERPLLSTCVIGFFVMAFVSILFSTDPAASFSAFTELTLNWYLPFFACLLVIRSEKDVTLLYKTIALLSLFVAALGVFDFITERNWTLQIIPKGMLASMMDANPTIADMVNASPYRNGYYRASSIYNVPLSYGEFAAIVAPISGYFILHAHKQSDRVLGFLVLGGTLLSLFVSGSRGGSIAFLASMPLLLGLWVIRYSSTHPRSVIGPLFAAGSAMGVSALLTLVMVLPRLHKIVFGGGDAASSDDSRGVQWSMGLKRFYENPITGHGIGRGGEVVGYHNPGGGLSIDTYALNLLVETGLPGLIFYFGMIIGAAAILIKIYLTDKDPRAEIGAPIASSLIAYGVYRLVLSQRENQTLFFIFLAIAFVVAQASAKRLSQKSRIPPQWASVTKPATKPSCPQTCKNSEINSRLKMEAVKESPFPSTTDD